MISCLFCRVIQKVEFNAPDVIKAGGLDALKILGEPKDIINETKEKLFSA